MLKKLNAILSKYSSLLIQVLLNHFLPLSCLLCQQNCQHPLSLCSACLQLLPIPDPKTKIESEVWQRFRFLSDYQTPIKELIQAGKFNDKLAVFKLLGQLLAKIIIEQGYDKELIIIPVPLHQSRLLSRGYNQANEIALPLAKLLGLKINNHCVCRIQETKTQHFLSKQQRLINAKSMFKIEGTVPEKVAIVDDIFTTGATMTSICTCLQQAGAKQIEVWIIARTLKQSSGIIQHQNS